jgi:endonuclease/exonuclease/phosphatase family metal-dependent hydrolase
MDVSVNKANVMFRVMSYNIRNSNAKDGENCWANRKELVASMVRFHHAGLIGTQEVLKDQYDDLRELLPEFGSIGVGRDDGKAAGEFAAIYYLKERFTVEDSGHFWLSEQPDQPGKGWDARCVRIVTWAKFSDRETNKQFCLFNTHFDHAGEAAKRQSAYLLLNRVETIAGAMPLVVTGDFNCIPESSVYRILTGEEACGNGFYGNHLIDSEAVSICKHHGPSTTTIDNFDPEFYTHKIDYIFIKNRVTVLTHGILADHFDKRYSSDHMPVAADLMIEA